MPQIPPSGQGTLPVGTSPNTQTEQIGELGSITKPKFSNINPKKKKEFLKLSDNLINRIKNLQELFSENNNITMRK
jgi:hypothetical protein